MAWQATLKKLSLCDSSDPVECQELLVLETNLPILLMPSEMREVMITNLALLQTDRACSHTYYTL